MRLTTFSVLALLSASITSHAGRYARYNYLGYFPAALKRIVILSDDNCAGTKWEIKDKSGTSVLSGTVGKSVCGNNDHTPMAFNHTIDFSAVNKAGTYTFTMAGIKPFKLTVKKNPYKSVIQSNLRWLRVSRSGSKDVLDRKPAHFGDSVCYIFRRKGAESTSPWEEDPSGKKVNMLGGWYDGFVYTKTTLVAALTAYALLRAYETNPSLFVKKYSKTDLIDILDEAKWGLDYLVKTMPDKKEFIISVGGFADNERGTLLPHEDPLEGKRECYSFFSPPQMGNTAATLALGSVVFSKAGNAADAKKYKETAIAIFNAACSKAAAEPAWLEKEYDIFKDESSYDNLLLAAAELYRATKEKTYLTQAKKFAGKAKNAWWVSYENVNMMGHLRIMDAYPTSKKYLEADLSDFHKRASSSSNIWSAPLEYSFCHIYATIETALATLQYQLATADKKYETMTMHMIDYVYGCNNWGLSFVSLPRIKKKCVRNYYSQIYMLQTNLFPEGAVSVGPLDAKSHDEESTWCYFDPKALPEFKFNTEMVKFFDHHDDYMCMVANSYGVAENIFLCTLLSTIYGK